MAALRRASHDGWGLSAGRTILELTAVEAKCSGGSQSSYKRPVQQRRRQIEYVFQRLRRRTRYSLGFQSRAVNHGLANDGRPNKHPRGPDKQTAKGSQRPCPFLFAPSSGCRGIVDIAGRRWAVAVGGFDLRNMYSVLRTCRVASLRFILHVFQNHTVSDLEHMHHMVSDLVASASKRIIR
jgi:hypothetical protein